MPATSIPENCPAWLAQWIGSSDQRLCNIEKSLVHLVKRQAQKTNPESKPKESDKITFKWLVEKFFVPAMFILAGYFLRGV